MLRMTTKEFEKRNLNKVIELELNLEIKDRLIPVTIVRGCTRTSFNVFRINYYVTFSQRLVEGMKVNVSEDIEMFEVKKSSPLSKTENIFFARRDDILEAIDNRSILCGSVKTECGISLIDNFVVYKCNPFYGVCEFINNEKFFNLRNILKLFAPDLFELDGEEIVIG